MGNELIRCPIHPKYKGKKEPKYSENPDCKCYSVWLKLRKPRVIPMPTKVVKDKSKYTRKKKHKKQEDK